YPPGRAPDPPRVAPDPPDRERQVAGPQARVPITLDEVIGPAEIAAQEQEQLVARRVQAGAVGGAQGRQVRLEIHQVVEAVDQRADRRFAAQGVEQRGGGLQGFDRGLDMGGGHQASRRVSRGGARSTPRRASAAPAQAAAMPTPTPASHGQALRVIRKSNTKDDSAQATALAPAAASRPASPPTASTSSRWARASWLRVAPSARSTAASRTRSSRVAVSAADSTSTPAARVNTNSSCTAMTTWSSTDCSWFRMEPTSNTVRLGNCRSSSRGKAA